MGWCHEFVLQIKDGCDLPMVAGESACHCESCQMVCEGRFAGCADVWARGPVPIAVGRSASEVRRQEAGVILGLPSRPQMQAETAEVPSHPLAGDLRPGLPSRDIDLRWVGRNDPGKGPRLAAQLTSADADLYGRIIVALGAALENQHRAIMTDVHEAISISETATASLLDQFAGRLAGRLDEFGDRIGGRLDQLADQVRGLVDAPRPAAAEPGDGERNVALLAEIDQLTRVVAGTIELLGQRPASAELRPGKNGTQGSNGG